MKSDYSRDIFKQLEETMKRLDKMESTLENTNSSLPPSSDEKPVKAANEFNHRNKTK